VSNQQHVLISQAAHPVAKPLQLTFQAQASPPSSYRSPQQLESRHKRHQRLQHILPHRQRSKRILIIGCRSSSILLLLLLKLLAAFAAAATVAAAAAVIGASAGCCCDFCCMACDGPHVRAPWVAGGFQLTLLQGSEHLQAHGSSQILARQQQTHSAK
jgi:hypothetical protein